MQVRIVKKPPARGLPARVRYASLVGPIPRSIRWSFLFFVATIPLDTLQIASNLLTLTKLAGFVFLACYILSTGFPFRLSFPYVPSPMWGFVVYFVAYALTGLVVEDGTMRSYIMRLLRVIQLVVLFWFASELFGEKSFTKKCLLTLSLSCAVLAIGTSLGLPGFTPDLSQQAETTERASAFEHNPNTFGALMAYAAVILLGLSLVETAWSASRKIILISLVLPLLGAIVQTGSRAAIGAAIIGMSFFFVPHRGSRRQMMAFFLGLAAIIGILYRVVLDPLASERWSAIQGGETARREEIYSAALEMFLERPILGWGGREAFEELGRRIGADGAVDAHNLVLYLMIEVGIVGAIPFLIGLLMCVRSAWKGRTGAFGMLPFALIMTAFAYSMTHTGLNAKVLWLILGFAVAVSQEMPVLRYRRVISAKGVRLPEQADRISTAIAASPDS